jgi:hypothetical protein
MADGTLRPYSLPGVRYTAPRTQTFTPTPITPDLQAAAALQGSAASMAGVAETIAKLPEMLQKAEQRGRTNTQAREVAKYKMGKLAEGGSLEDFTFGADDQLQYKYTDPALRNLKLQSEQANLDYRKAATNRANRTPVPGSTTRTRVPFDNVFGPGVSMPAERTVEEGSTDDPAIYDQGDAGPKVDDVIGTPAPPVTQGPSEPPQVAAPPPEPKAPATGPVTADQLQLPSGPAGGDSKPALMEPIEPQGKQALAQMAQEAAYSGALAKRFEQASDWDTKTQQHWAPQDEHLDYPGVFAAPPAAEPVVVQKPIVQRAAEAAPAVAAAARSALPDNGIFYENGDDPRVVGRRIDTLVRRKNGITTDEYVPGSTGWKKVEDPRVALRAKEDEILLKAGFDVDEISTMSKEDRKERVKAAAKAQGTSPEYRTELKEARIRKPGLTKEAWDAMDDDQKSAVLALPVPLTPSEITSKENSIRNNYESKRSKVRMFGSNQAMGIDEILDGMDALKKAAPGGDLKNLSEVDQKRFVFWSAKLNDPGSAVLLSEYQAAADTLGIGDKFKLWMGKQASGQQVTPEQANDIYRVVKIAHDAARDDYLEDVASTIKSAKKYGIDPEEVGVPGKVMRWVKEQEALDRAKTPINAPAPSANGAPASTSVSAAANPPITEMGPAQVLAEIEAALASPDGTYRGQKITPEFRTQLQAKASILESKLGKAQAAAARADVPKLPVIAPPSRRVPAGTRLSPADLSE